MIANVFSALLDEIFPKKKKKKKASSSKGAAPSTAKEQKAEVSA
jgi:hypothetical protein